jgi:hypothetical protein
MINLLNQYKVSNDKLLEVVYITTISSREIDKSANRTIYYPSFWSYYNDKLLYSICYGFEFSLFETYDDWDNFNQFFPGEKEYNILINLPGIIHYEIEYEIFLDDKIRDQISQWEFDIISSWNRDIKIKNLLK